MRRAAVFGPEHEWHAIRNSAGLWVLVDAHGHQPLASPDPIERCFAAHLAAQAPAFRAVLAEMARRWESLVDLHGHDVDLLQFAHGSVALSFPSPSTQMAVGAFSSKPVQLELSEQQEVVPESLLPRRDRVLRLRKVT